jgi:DNA-binding transcriptional regulator of glucitol operon
MQRQRLSWAATAALCALTLAACSKQPETQVDRVAMEAKAKAEAEAKAVEAAAKEAEAAAKEAEARVIAIEATSTPTRWSPWR